MSCAERYRVHPTHLPVRTDISRVLGFAAEATRPLSALDVNVDLVTGMNVDALPFPRAHNEPLQDNMIVRQHDLPVRIFKVGVCQQERLIFFRRLLWRCTVLRAAGDTSQGVAVGAV
jgi:hypothetical protein